MGIRLKDALVGGLVLATCLGSSTAVATGSTSLGMTSAAAPISGPAAFASSLDSDLLNDREVVREQLKIKLLEMAGACKKKKLFATRAELYGLVLEMDPENGEAHKGLGHKKQKDGTWKVPTRRVPPKDKSKSLAEEMAAEKEAAIDSYAEHLLAVLESYTSTARKEDRELLMDDILAVDPNHAAVRESRGEARAGDDWVLKETVVAKTRRAELKGLMRAAFASLPQPSIVEPSAREAAFGLNWSAVITSPVGRTLGTVSKAEIEKLSQAMWVTHSYFNAALGARAKLPKNLTVYSFKVPKDGLKFVEKHPDVDDEYRAFLKRLEGSGIQGTDDFAQWSANEQRRLDGLVRQALAWLFAGGFEIFPKHGWAFEGLGLYLTREIAGSRLTWFVGPSKTMDAKAEQELRDRLMEPTTNWMNEAHKILQAPGRPALKQLLLKSTDELTPEDLLYSYVLAAYLIEAEGARLPQILRSIGKGKSSVLTLKSELNTQIPELEERIRRWLSERLAR